MSALSIDQDSCRSIVSIRQNNYISRSSTREIYSPSSPTHAKEDLYYSVHIEESVLKRKPTKEQEILNEKSNCSTCLTF